ncbi:hypothetical protein LRP50_24330 [Enterovibrio sp. ZSDZ42]|uniref:DUF4942 domain-containing protein n=1 Tax=Enterovibrio gelatinilyticus TaxID=2899819 RepID=A0ABT5R7K2_9GAMM|nr:hypothetical protein [Enterovibrio sp. ZSDZ42]MDD1796252.1 hypothetical protein [Enterovibrio sp. ZSDZ42]
MEEMVRKIDDISNFKLVNEVLQFARSNKLLTPTDDTKKHKNVICELDEAKYYAWEKTYGDDELTWADYRANKVSDIWEKIYENDDKFSDIENLLTSILEELSEEVKRKLDIKHSALLDDVISDLEACIYSRVIEADSNSFFEGVFSSYTDGFWPCGFKSSTNINDIILYSRSVEINKQDAQSCCSE